MQRCATPWHVRRADWTQHSRWTAAAALVAASAGWLGGCNWGNDSASDSTPGAVVFEAPEVLTQARVLVGDPTSDRCSDTNQPCFENNKDILNGQRTLAAVDDMQVVLVSAPDGQPNEDRIVTLQTADSSFVSRAIAVAEDGNAGSRLLNASALGARFAPGADSLVRLQLYEVNPPPPGFGKYMVTARTGSALVSVPFDGQPDSSLLSAAADFSGSGTEAVVFVAGRWIGAMTPVVEKGVVSRLVAGDLNGIGSASALTTANFFGSGPLAVAAVTGTALEVQFFSLDDRSGTLFPNFLADKTIKVSLRQGNYVVPGTARLVAGRFTDPDYDQLVLAFEEGDSASNSVLGVTLVLIDRDDSGSVRQTVTSGALRGALTRQLKLAKGRFLVGDTFEGVAVARNFGSAGGNLLSVSLVGFDTDRKPVVEATASTSRPTCLFGMDSGNFDRRVTDDAGQQIVNRNLQIGLLLGLECADVSNRIQAAVWQVSPGSGSAAPTRLSLRGSGPDTAAYEIPVDGSIPIRNPIVGLSLAVLDTQGRSQVLGPPKVLTIDTISQPTLIVSAPPMHADWAVDAQGGGFQLTNLTLAPDGFNARYSTSAGTDATATTQSKSTWSFSAEESISAKYTYGDCDKSLCASIEDKVSAKQELGGSTAALNSRFSQSDVKVSQRTFASDLVSFKDSTLTVYVYPVLGKTSCPAAKPTGCDAAERVPTVLLVAGPDTVRQTNADGSTLPWYQPPWVPGNVLSYPGTLGQLRAAAQLDASRFKPLSQSPTWTIDQTEVEQEASWSSGVKNGSSVKSSGNFSGNNTLSVYGKGGIEGEFSAEASLKFSVGGSTGFKNLSDSDTTVTQSSGLALSKRADFEDTRRYSYQFTPTIFSQTTPGGADSANPAADGFGALQSGFIVDLNSDGGQPREFWLANYNRSADLALLHPARYTVSTLAARPAQDGQRCVAYASNGYNCVDAVGSEPGKLIYDEHHWMRGFFISEAGAAGNGPLKTTAIDGDQLVLQARVHNLSLKAMAPGTQLKVAFYGMVWDRSKNARISNFYIGTALRQTPVPPYHTSDDTPNWALLSQPFDASGYGGKDIYFWVVAWMTDASGKLVGEPDGRGLKGIPDSNTDYAAAVALEGERGNNVGLFNMAFHVFDKTTAAAAPPATAATAPSLTITEVGSDSYAIASGKPALVAARVKAGAFDLPRGTSVVFYDGDPASGGRVIGLQRQPFLRAQTSYDFRVPFRSAVCGTHRIHVVTGPGTRFEHKVRLRPIEVGCG